MRLGRSMLLAVTLCCTQPAQSLAVSGDPDPSFQGGVVRFTGTEAWGLALTPAGEPVVAGNGIAHLRLTPDGRPAAGYEGGPLRAPFDRYEYARASSVAAQPDGKVVIGGRVSRPAGSFPQNVFLRYLPDGRLDPSFGAEGLVFHDLTPDRTTVEEVLDTAIDRAGRIVFLGEVGRAPVIGRLLPDGRLDASFAGGFVPVGNVKGFGIEAYDIAVTPDGGVIAVGMDSVPVVLRLTSDGALDTTFGDGGVTSVTLARRDARGFNLALGPSGTFVVAGNSLGSNEHDNRFWAMRFTADGRVDPRFGGPDGVSTTIPAPPRDPEPYPTHREGGANDVAVRADGKVVLVGSHGMVLQLLPDGAADPSFGGGDGIALLADADQLEDVALQPDGKIVVSQRSGFVVWRLQGDGHDVPPTAPEPDPTPATPAPDRASQPSGPGVPVTSAAPPAPATEKRVTPAAARPVLVTVNRRGLARVPIVCPARGRCAGIVRVRVDGRIADQRRFSFRTRGAQRRVTIRLNARSLKLLRRDTRVDARVTVQIGRHRTHESVTLTT